MTNSTDIEGLKPIGADPAESLARLMNAKLGTDVKPSDLRDFVTSYYGTLSVLAREVRAGDSEQWVRTSMGV